MLCPMVGMQSFIMGNGDGGEAVRSAVHYVSSSFSLCHYINGPEVLAPVLFPLSFKSRLLFRSTEWLVQPIPISFVPIPIQLSSH